MNVSICAFSGCFWHSHCSSKEDCQWVLRKAVHPTRRPLTYEDVNLETATRIQRLQDTDRPVHCIWVCDIVRQMSVDPLLSAFMKDHEMLSRYKKPLEPSLAVSKIFLHILTKILFFADLWRPGGSI